MSSVIPPDSPRAESDYIRLERAQLCADCDAIFNMSRPACPSCGSGSALSLPQVLNEKNEIVEALRAFSKLVALAKRPAKKPKKEKPHENPVLQPGN